MSTIATATNRRILVIDDYEGIHEDFRKILEEDPSGRLLAQADHALFDPGETERESPRYEVCCCSQGEEGLEQVREARRRGTPFALAFVDMRMPPGWDGVETIERIWKEDPEIQAVICSAYSDYSWDEITDRLGPTDRLLILKKPFDIIEVSQLASALTRKWELFREARQKMEQLGELVKKRTKELSRQNRQLRHAQTLSLQTEKMASIGQLAAGVAHEINNPIGYVSSNLNTLSRYVGELKQVIGAYDGVWRAYSTDPTTMARKAAELQQVLDACKLDYILSDVSDLLTESIEGAERVRKIVADLREFSHEESDAFVAEDLNALTEKTINIVWNKLKYKTEVVREFGEVPPIPCLAGQIVQVLVNLLVNAADAIEERGRITVRTGREGDRAFVEVEDTGHGIEEEHMGRLFDPFFTTRGVGEGTGLGLTVVYRIVHAHGGEVTVHSRAGEGATFRVALPVGEPEGEDHATE